MNKIELLLVVNISNFCASISKISATIKYVYIGGIKNNVLVL